MTSRGEPTSLADEMSRQERSRRVVIVLFMMGLTFWDVLKPFFMMRDISNPFFVMSLTFLGHFESVLYDESNFWGYFESVFESGADENSRGAEQRT